MFCLQDKLRAHRILMSSVSICRSSHRDSAALIVNDSKAPEDLYHNCISAFSLSFLVFVFEYLNGLVSSKDITLDHRIKQEKR